jgi:hypothetical protein
MNCVKLLFHRDHYQLLHIEQDLWEARWKERVVQSTVETDLSGRVIVEKLNWLEGPHCHVHQSQTHERNNGPVISSLVTPVYIIMWDRCCAASSNKCGFCLAHKWTFQSLVQGCIAHSPVNVILCWDAVTGKVCSKVAYACCSMTVSWSVISLVNAGGSLLSSSAVAYRIS